MAVGALCKEGHPRVLAKLVERRRREGEATPEERKLSVRRLDNVGKLWAETLAELLRGQYGPWPPQQNEISLISHQ
jgi:hypothetical protein